MRTYSYFACLLISLVGCSSDSLGDSISSAKQGVTQLGTTVQAIGASDEVKGLVDGTKQTLITTGELGQSAAESAKDALTSVGEATVIVGDTASSTLTGIGNVVLEAKSSLTVPDSPPPTNSR